MIQTFRCSHCGHTLKRTVKKRKAWHRSYCEMYNRVVRAKSVRPV